MYGYLAIAGGSINAPEVMGSRSTNLKCGIGGWKGRALITGDYLPFCTRNIDFIPNLGSHTVDRDDAFYGFDDPEITLRVVPGPKRRRSPGHVHARRRRGHLLQAAPHRGYRQEAYGGRGREHQP